MPEHLHLDVASTLEAASAARRAVREWVALPDGLRWSTELVCGELLANSVRHGLPPVQIDVVLDHSCLRIAVSDGAPTLGPPTTTSRGLGIVDSITEQWGVDYGPRGKTVWAEVHPAATEAARSRTQALGLSPRAEADQLRRIYDFAPIGIAITDWHGPFLRCNPAYAAILGYSEEELRALDFASIIHPDDLEENLKLTEGVIAGDIPSFEIENRYVHKDGHTVWVHKAVMSLPDPGGKTGQFVAVVSDISDLMATEAAQRSSEQRFQTTFEQVAVGVAHADLEGRFLRCNRKFCEFLGYTREELAQHTFQDLTHPDDLEMDLDQVERLVGGEIDEYSVEKRYLRKDGSVTWTHLTVSIVRDSPDEDTYMIGIIEDINERKAAEQALRATATRDRQARAQAELTMQIFRALERIEGVRPRAQLLCDLLATYGVGVALLLCTDPAAGHECVYATHHRRHDDVRHALARSGVLHPESIATELGAHDVVHVAVDMGYGVQASLVLIDTANELIDRGFVDDLADRVGVLLASARVREEEHAISLRLQEALLPDRLVSHPMVRIRARYKASGQAIQVGGDWYDAFALDNGTIGITVGDVVGHGLDAASTMGRLRTAAAALAPRSPGPGSLLSHLDQFARGPDGTDFATATFAMLDPATRILRYASAGHPPALVVSPDSNAQWLDAGGSTPLTVPVKGMRAEARTRLDPGSLVVWCSDGLIERRGEPIDRGLERLARTVLQHHHQPLDELCDTVIHSVTEGTSQEDDIVLLALRLAA